MKQNNPASILDILTECTEKTPPSMDRERSEMLWSDRSEDLLHNYQLSCRKQSDYHSVCYKKFKKLNAIYSLPTMVIPIILSGLTTVLDDYPLVTNLSLIFTGCLSGINIFFGYSKKSEKHNNFSGKFCELSMEIENELSKPKRFRQASDVFQQKIYSALINLNNSAPN